MILNWVKFKAKIFTRLGIKRVVHQMEKKIEMIEMSLNYI